MKINNELKAFFVLISTIIGLGVFVLPYTFSQSGYYFLFWLIFWIFSFLILHLVWGEILFQTKEKYNLPGLVSIYLNPKLKHLVWIFDYFGMIGIILIYFLVLADFWTLILPIPRILIKILFFLFNIYFIFKNLQIFAKFETFLSLSIIFIFLTISFSILGNFNFENIKIALNQSKNIFLPYGILLFSFFGTSAVPIVYDLIGKNKKSYFIINLLALLTVGLLYLIYTLTVVGFLGTNVSEESLNNLKSYFPKIFFILAILLVTLNITFVDFAFYLKRGLIYDYKISPTLSNLILAFSIFPLVFFEPSSNLVDLISLVSNIFLGFNLLIILLIYLKLKKYEYFNLPKPLIFLLIFIFLLGIIYGVLPK